jgi:hypothetical protein
VGAHLLNHLQDPVYEVTWWRERDREVDYVVRGGRQLWALTRGTEPLALTLHRTGYLDQAITVAQRRKRGPGDSENPFR